ncbi:MAG: potassium-transporting ATPase subunit KdpA [Elusimicrobia bacterium]|nr:potassium-transporting ATPase subunit KdpA [Elusimicrobiota bacterium]
MNANNLLQCAVYLAALLALSKPLGTYMARVYEGRAPGLGRALGPIERLIYRLCGTNPDEEMSWQTYALAMLLLNAAGIFAVYLIQRVQQHLPLNPMHLGPVAPDSSFNTAVSFVTNTNWQDYTGETTMSYLTQMLALTVQNFLSAATGIAVAVALIRGFARKQMQTIGNFWVDMVRTTLYILLPMSAVFAIVLVWQGSPQTLKPSATIPLLQATKDANGKAVSEQIIALGPVASQEAIKMLGTNGGGYFNANSAHPFENPTPLTNFLETVGLLLIGAALCHVFGQMVGDKRQGWALLAAMTIIFVPLMWFCVVMEQRGNPAFSPLGVDQAASALQPGGNMEGKEARFGIADTAVFATATTAASCGAVDSMHDSFTPLGGMVPLFMMQLGEVVYGGVGSGLYGMLLYAIIAVFLAGLMVGRTPEYLGKKIEAYEMKMASIGVLVTPSVVLVGTAIGVLTAAGKAGIANPGPHGFSEILYAFTSATNNNGSAFAGLSVNTLFYNVILALAMFLGRFWIALPVLAIAGSLARKKHVPESAGTLPTHTPLFVFFLVGIVIFVGALTYFPALALGPIAENLMMLGS